MIRALLTLFFLLCLAARAYAAPSYATLTGTVTDNDGSACALCDVTIRTAATQAISTETFPQEPYGTTYTTDANGDLPAGVFVARTLIVGITIAHDPNEIRVRIPDQSTVNIADLVLPPVAPPVGCTGCIVAANIAAGAVTYGKLGTSDTPADEECLTYESTGDTMEWQACGGGGSGITGVAADSGGTTTGSTVTLAGGAGVATTRSSDTVTIATASSEGSFITGSTSLPGTCSEGAVYQDTNSSGVELYVCTASNTWSKVAPERVFDVRTYGAACDASTDDVTAIQAAIDAADAAGGGIVQFPAGICRCASALTLDDYQGIILQGQGGRQTSGSATILDFNITGAGSLLSAKSISGLTIRDMAVRTVHASFTGKLIDVSHSGTGGDANLIELDNVYVLDTGGGARSSTLLYLDKAHTVQVRDSRFENGGYAVYGTALTYSNAVSITGTYFANQDTAPIWNPSDSWSIIGNTFEQTRGGTSVGIGHDSGVIGRGLIIAGNIFNDSTTGTSSWITTASSGVNITGNLFAGHAAGSEVGITIDASTFSGVIDGNTFVNLGTGVDCTAGTIGYRIDNNTFTSVTTRLNSDCDGGTTGGVQTTQQAVINSATNVFVNLDSDSNSSGAGFVVAHEGTGTSAAQLFEVSENGNVNLFRGMDLRLFETDNTNYIDVSAPTLAANWTLTLPTTDGNANEVLKTDGSGVLGWTSNIATATALAANPSDCASDTYATTIAANGNLTCATVTSAGITDGAIVNADINGSAAIAVSKTALVDGAGLALSGNTLATASSEGSFLTGSTSLPGTCSEGAVYQDTDSGGTETYVCTASNTWTKTITATDNVATATALAANPADCSSNQFATTIAANGDLTCSALTLASAQFANQGTTTTVLHGNAAGNPSFGQVTNSDLAGSIAVSKTLLSDGAGILLSTNTLSTASTEANFIANAASLTCSSSAGKLIVDSTTDSLSYCSSGGSSVKYAALGNDNGQASFLSATSCTNGVVTASDGTPTCAGSPDTPETIGRWYTNKTASLPAYSVVKFNGTNTPDQVIEATTSSEDPLGCAQNTTTLAVDDPVFVVTQGVATCKFAVLTIANKYMGMSNTAAGTLKDVSNTARLKRFAWLLDGDLTSPGEALLMGGGFYAPTTIHPVRFTPDITTTEKFMPIVGLTTADAGSIDAAELPLGVGSAGRLHCELAGTAAANLAVKLYKNNSASRTCTISSGATSCDASDATDAASVATDLWAIGAKLASGGPESDDLWCTLPFTFAP